MEYTKEIHVNRMRNMLSKKRECEKCPERKWYSGTINYDFITGERVKAERNYICKICWGFIGFPERASCPCNVLGHDEAIAAAHAALALWDAGEHPMQEEEKE